MNTKEIAQKLVSYCRQGDFESAYKELYSPEIESLEPEGSPQPHAKGMEAIMKKNESFQSMIESYHGNEVSDPIVAENFFAVSMKMDVTFKGAPRAMIEEICLYNVENGKIVREQFFYTPQPEQVA